MKIRARKAYLYKTTMRKIGNRCKAYCYSCVICESYRFLRETNRFPYTYDELASWFLSQPIAVGFDEADKFAFWQSQAEEAPKMD